MTTMMTETVPDQEGVWLVTGLRALTDNRTVASDVAVRANNEVDAKVQAEAEYDFDSFTAMSARFMGAELPVIPQLPKDAPAGLYLSLYHGRFTPQQDMDDWGFDGPVIGPLSNVHGTYATTLRAMFTKGAPDALKGPFAGQDEAWLTYEKDLIQVGEYYYGDFTVFYHEGK